MPKPVRYLAVAIKPKTKYKTQAERIDAEYPEGRFGDKFNEDRAARMRQVAELYFGPEDLTWLQVSEKTGILRETLWKWRQTEMWERVRDDVAAEIFDDDMRRLCLKALRKKLADGDTQVVIRVAESLRYIGPERRDFTFREAKADEDLDAQLEELLGRAARAGLASKEAKE
jgi:hypothetical protein